MMHHIITPNAVATPRCSVIQFNSSPLWIFWNLWTLVTDPCPLSHLSSSPEAADSSSFDVQLGDIILTASDGLFDNMPDYMILRELKKLKVPLRECKYFHTESTDRKDHLPNVIPLLCV